MSKRNGKTSRAGKSAHDDYDLPPEVAFGKARFIGFGLKSLEKYVAEKGKKPTAVQLDPDVARVFGTSESVNTMLRSIIQGLASAGKRKKSA